MNNANILYLFILNIWIGKEIIIKTMLTLLIITITYN